MRQSGSFFSREGSDIVNNISKAHLFGSACLVYNLCLLEECRKRKGKKWGSGERRRQPWTPFIQLFILNVAIACLNIFCYCRHLFFFCSMLMKMKCYFTLKALLLQWDFNHSAFVQKPPNTEMNKRFDSCTLVSSSDLFSCASTCIILCEQAKPNVWLLLYLYVVDPKSKIVDNKKKYTVWGNLENKIIKKKITARQLVSILKSF